jgi:glycosyltransferase involved in cell wall biosynthesis
LRTLRLGGYFVFFRLTRLLVLLLTAALRAVGFGARAARWRIGEPRRVLYLSAYFPGNASHDQRVEAWAGVLRASGYGVDVRWALDGPRFAALTSRSDVTLFQTIFLLRRLRDCVTAFRYHAVVVHRELLTYNDYGGLFLERFLLAVNPNVALDFDDDLGAAKRQGPPASLFAKLMGEGCTKFRDSLRLYPFAIAGSRYLAALFEAQDQERGVPPNVVIIPTCVDLDLYPVKTYGASDEVRFGWIGTTGNQRQLDAALPALEHLFRERAVRLVVISGARYERPVPFPIENVAWTPTGFYSGLVSLDVGLMPVRDDADGRGKCGFKLLQYMACGIVGVASAVTTNTEIVLDGVNGFLVKEREGWAEALRRVVASRDRFPSIGQRARETVRTKYTFSANRETYLDFMTRLAAGR